MIKYKRRTDTNRDLARNGPIGQNRTSQALRGILKRHTPEGPRRADPRVRTDRLTNLGSAVRLQLRDRDTVMEPNRCCGALTCWFVVRGSWICASTRPTTISTGRTARSTPLPR